MFHKIHDYVMDLSFVGILIFSTEMLGGLIVLIILLMIFKQKVFKMGRKQKLTSAEMERIKNLRISPSGSAYIFKSGKKKADMHLSRMIANYEGSYSTKSNRPSGEDTTIGKYGENEFQRKNVNAKAEVLIASSNFKGYIDFSKPERIYEIKTTDFKGIVSETYEYKWMYQLGCYVFLTKKPGTLQVYQHNGNGKVIEKYKKFIKVDSDIVTWIEEFDTFITEWKDKLINRSYLIYKPKTVWEATRLWFGGEAMKRSRSVKKNSLSFKQFFTRPVRHAIKTAGAGVAITGLGILSKVYKDKLPLDSPYFFWTILGIGMITIIGSLIAIGTMWKDIKEENNIK